MAWIFQGNPKRYPLDDYLARFPELIYWRAPRYQAEIAVGERAFLWRAGDESGVIASGTIVEAPVPAAQVAHPEALGEDLWLADKPNDGVLKVGIALDSVRLSVAAGMLPRAVVKEDPLLRETTIITMPNQTVFRLNRAQGSRMEELWTDLSSTMLA